MPGHGPSKAFGDYRGPKVAGNAEEEQRERGQKMEVYTYTSTYTYTCIYIYIYICIYILLCIFIYNQVQQANTQIQALFDCMLASIAHRAGYKTPTEYVAKELGGVVYHFTLSFMGGHTLEHMDEYIGDGPGRWIYNLTLQGAGLLYFVEDQKRPDGTQLDMHAMWQVLHTHTGSSHARPNEETKILTQTRTGYGRLRGV